MANTIVTEQKIAKLALANLENNMVMGNLVTRDLTKEFMQVSKPGATMSVRKPVKFRAKVGPNRQNQDIKEDLVPVTINKSYHVSWSWDLITKTLSIEEVNKRYIKPAMLALAQQVDYDLTGLHIDVYNAVGTANTTPATTATLFSAMRRLNEESVPITERAMVIDPAAEASLADVIAGKYQPEMVKGALKEAALGRLAKFDIYGSQNIRVHTPGSDFTSVTVNGANQVGSTLTAAGGSFKKGDIFTAAGCYAVNPSSGQSTGVLRQFVCTADGTTSLSIYPSIITSGAYQTVTASPTDGGAITAVGTASTDYTCNLAFHKDAFGLVMAKLEKPEGAAYAENFTYNGMSVLVTKAFDIDTMETVIRLDILYGVKTFYPEMAARVLG